MRRRHTLLRQSVRDRTQRRTAPALAHDPLDELSGECSRRGTRTAERATDVADILNLRDLGLRVSRTESRASADSRDLSSLHIRLMDRCRLPSRFE